MKLQALQINGLTVGVEISDPYEYDITKTPMIYKTVTKTGYIDVVLNYSNIKLFELFNGDHVSLRKMVNIYIESIAGVSPTYPTWNLLSANDKELAYKYVKHIDPARIITDYIADGLSAVEATKKYKVKRAMDIAQGKNEFRRRAESPVINYIAIKYLSEEDANTFMDETRDYIIDLKDRSYLGTMYGQSRSGIMDYIEGTGIYTAGPQGLSKFTFLNGYTYLQCHTEFHNYIIEGEEPDEYITYNGEYL